MEKHTTDGISYPPRGLGRVAAARYLGVGITKFEEMVAAGELPKPKTVGGRVIWDRFALDVAFSDFPEKERTKEAEFIAQHRARKAAVARAKSE